MRHLFAAAFLSCLLPFAQAQAETPRLSLPVQCAFGTECFIQQYPDLDPGPGHKDYTCGAQSYDGHEGTDFRAWNMAAIATGVPVLAAAPGRVKGTRDGMADDLVVTPERRAAMTDKFCGNGVVIDHGQGWETQYCHLRRGSIEVRSGQMVERGTRLGMLGSSGMSEFPHIQLSVRKDGTPIDPFQGTALPGQCGRSGTPLWTAQAMEVLAYQRGAIVNVGFATKALSPQQADDIVTAPTRTGPALVAFGLAINLEKGDVPVLSLTGPNGPIGTNRGKPLERRKARYLIYTGKRNKGNGFAAGQYVATLIIERNGKQVMSKTSEFQLK